VPHWDYFEHGFTVLPSTIDHDSIARVEAAMHFPVCDQLKRLARPSKGKLFDDLVELYRTDEVAYLATVRVFSRLLAVQKLCLDERILGAIGNLGMRDLTVPTSPVIHLLGRNLRIAGGYFGQPPHQDWPSMQGSLNAVVAWIPLVDIDMKLFPIEVCPGSHRFGMLKGRVEEHHYEIIDRVFADSEFVPLETKAGDLVLMSSFLVHRSSTNGDDRVRISCSLRYEDLEEETYAERGYPTAYKRNVHRELYFPDFPSLDQVNQSVDQLKNRARTQ
jgi:ectoine hydroxylase-related dioxygenase (phytanoyl-CoA dioxygenase family)